MYEIINEPIKVLVSFSGLQVKPQVLIWRGKKYVIEKVNLVAKDREGEALIYHFSVSDKANYFKISFNTKNLSWQLEELYNEQ
ncbi:MAG: hypothetical protein ACD_12C00743G0001 [uncultured bacterium]|nr:MAG: hypothetical protein ACD_12C00743G0001 [uncultured bacterium]